MKDIENIEDIQLFVNEFYGKIQEDDLLGPVFALKIEKDNWQVHLDKMYGFWNTVLFGAREYQGNPFSKHRPLPIEKRHFDRWLALLNTTLDQHFSGVKVEEIKTRAEKMGLLFQSKLDYLRNDDHFKSII